MTTAAAPTPTRLSALITGAYVTTTYLFGGTVAGIGLGMIIASPPGGMMSLLSPWRVTVGSIAALTCITAGGALWARALARRIDATDLRRAAWSGALGFGPAMLVFGAILNLAEVFIVSKGRGPAFPLHVWFGLLFVPTSFAVPALTTWVLGRGLRLDGSTMRRLAISSGVAAGVAFLVVYLLMDLAGWRVGAPGAAQRATMIVVSSLGCIAATIAGGAAVGAQLLARRF